MVPSIRKSLGRFFTTNAAAPPLDATPSASPTDARHRATQDMAPVERARRLRYKRFAAHQAMVEVEDEADHQRHLH